MSTQRESKFQSGLKKRLRQRYPGCLILKNDSMDIQGIPDLLVLFGNRWAMLECKRSRTESHRPNQDYYVDLLGSMGFASFIFPENEDEVLAELDQWFGV